MKMFIAIGSHFRIHWKLVVCFVVIWALIIVGIFIMPLSSKSFSIANSLLRRDININGKENFFLESTTPITTLYDFLFKGWGMLIYGAFIIVFINRILLKEVYSSQISLWLTQPLSKQQSILSKYIFLFISLTCFYLPAFIVLLSVSAAAVDARTLWINIFLGGLQTYIFLIMLSLIFFVIALLLINYATTFNVISSLIVGYFIFIGALEFVVLISDLENKYVDIVIKYVGPQVFITEILPHDLDAEPIKYIISKSTQGNETSALYIEATVVREIDKVSYGILTPLMACISAILIWLSILLFKRTSFSV